MGRVLRQSMGMQAIALEDDVVDGPPDPAGGSRPRPAPSAHGGDSSQSKSSPAIPTAVAVSLFILCALITWRCLVFFRNPRRAAVLARLGLVRRPRMFEVHPMPAPHLPNGGRMLCTLTVSSCKYVLTHIIQPSSRQPLSVAQVPLKSDATRLMPRSTFESGVQLARTRWHFAIHRQLRSHSQAGTYGMVDQSGAAFPGLSLQVAVLVAMPVEGRGKTTQSSPYISDEFAGVHIGTMHAISPTF
ncbi:hypothetical protein C8T65DRAFT_227730 [Cerioporus squamosus]|nr:hypothetical protein C8T65DRAFT_227730 [Cerioporus squamosus]